MSSSLISQIKAGDIDAFEKVFHNYNRELYRFFYKKLWSASLCEDLIQDTFAKIWIYRSRLNEEIDLDFQVFRIARTTLVDLVRKTYYEKTILLPVEKFPEVQAESAMFVLPDEKIDKIQRMLEDLPQKQKNILSMRLKGYSNKEIAHEFSISTRTVENNLQLAYRNIRKKYGVIPLLIVLLEKLLG